MLLLYFAIGERLSQKVAAENWGAKVIELLQCLKLHLQLRPYPMRCRSR